MFQAKFLLLLIILFHANTEKKICFDKKRILFPRYADFPEAKIACFPFRVLQQSYHTWNNPFRSIILIQEVTWHISPRSAFDSFGEAHSQEWVNRPSDIPLSDRTWNRIKVNHGHPKLLFSLILLKGLHDVPSWKFCCPVRGLLRCCIPMFFLYSSFFVFYYFPNPSSSSAFHHLHNNYWWTKVCFCNQLCAFD